MLFTNVIQHFYDMLHLYLEFYYCKDNFLLDKPQDHKKW